MTVKREQLVAESTSYSTASLRLTIAKGLPHGWLWSASALSGIDVPLAELVELAEALKQEQP